MKSLRVISNYFFPSFIFSLFAIKAYADVPVHYDQIKGFLPENIASLFQNWLIPVFMGGFMLWEFTITKLPIESNSTLELIGKGIKIIKDFFRFKKPENKLR